MGKERLISEFSGEIELDASDIDLAEGMRIEAPTKLSGKVKVTARGVGTARGISVVQPETSAKPDVTSTQRSQQHQDRAAQQATVIAAYTCPSCGSYFGVLSGSEGQRSDLAAGRA
jgi:hypothetical protein